MAVDPLQAKIDHLQVLFQSLDNAFISTLVNGHPNATLEALETLCIAEVSKTRKRLHKWGYNGAALSKHQTKLENYHAFVSKYGHEILRFTRGKTHENIIQKLVQSVGPDFFTQLCTNSEMVRSSTNPNIGIDVAKFSVLEIQTMTLEPTEFTVHKQSNNTRESFDNASNNTRECKQAPTNDNTHSETDIGSSITRENVKEETRHTYSDSGTDSEDNTHSETDIESFESSESQSHSSDDIPVQSHLNLKTAVHSMCKK
eukprot:202091_1